MNETLTPIDHSAMRVSQVIIILLNVLAFIFDVPWLAAMVTLFMILGALLSVPAFGFVYRYGLKPLGWVKPETLLDNPEPHRFAQALGGAFMAAGSLALFLDLAWLGWSLVWLVTALAALNAFGGFCVGCMIYYWMARFNVPGFYKSPPAGAFPGMRPRNSRL